VPWSNAPWIDTARQFLHSTQSQIILPSPWKTHLRRQHDRHIMDDILGLNLPQQQAIQLQSVRLYLQVTVLLEITDHSGLSILPCTFQQPNPQYTASHDNNNGSSLHWPNQPSPGPTAWKWWREIITWLYVNPEMDQLNTPLGLWTREHATDYKWAWQVCPTTRTLFQKKGSQWYAYQPVEHNDSRITYPNRESPTSPPQNMVPATPTITTQLIHLAISIYGMQKLTPNPPVTSSLHQQLVTPPNQWAEPLWHEIRLHAHINILHAQILSTTQIIIVSDVAVHADGWDTCTWTIWSNTKLWSGKGYAPGPITDMYLGLAEAYGLYTAPSFFQQYCQYYPDLLRNPRTIHAYCDNQGVIDWTSWTSPCLYLHDAISNDYPIYAELKHTINSLQPITVMLHHVKGHQDTKSNHPLTLLEKLNINCDDRASRLELHPNAVTFQNNPVNDSAYPHLVI